MHLKADTLDDALRKVFRRLLDSRDRIRPSKGPAREMVGALITIKNPRARFSLTEKRATLFSCLGETLWYLSGSDRLDVIEHYIPKYRERVGAPADAEITSGAYGPRIFGGGPASQMATILDLLARKPDTRQAVIQIFAADDVSKSTADVPCTCTLQFFPRGGRLHLVSSMRSNDAYMGLPHDVFAFTIIQELVARTIGCEIGTYSHFVGSLHLYDEDRPRARDYLAEGWQEKIEMPSMPPGNPWESVKWLLRIETAVRQGKLNPFEIEDIDGYWIDLARLLRMRALFRAKNLRAVVEEKNSMTSSVYDSFIRKRERILVRETKTTQPTLPGMDAAHPANSRVSP